LQRLAAAQYSMGAVARATARWSWWDGEGAGDVEGGGGGAGSLLPWSSPT